MARRKYLTPQERAANKAQKALTLFSDAHQEMLEAQQILTKHIEGNNEIIDSLAKENDELTANREANAKVIDKLSAFLPAI